MEAGNQTTAITTTATVSSDTSTKPSALDRLNALPARLDDETLGNLAKFASSAPPVLPAADATDIMRFIRLISTMPRRADDDASGKIRAELITRHLTGLPVPQINWMLHEALRRFPFFPSIHELTQLANEWTRDDEAVRARRAAGARIEHEMQTRIEDARAKLKWQACTPEWIATLPEHTVHILLRERLLKKDPATGATVQGDHYHEWRAFQQSQAEA